MQKYLEKITQTLKMFLIAAVFLLMAGRASAFSIEKYDDAIEKKFVVSPGKLDYKLSPGDAINAEVLVVNRLGEKKKFFVKKEIIGDKSNPLLLEAENSWIKPEVDEFTIDQGERIKFNIKIDVPSDALASGYYFSILIGTEGNNSGGKDQVKMISQIGLPMFITVEGRELSKIGEIENFITDKFFYGVGPVQFTSIFENQGNVHLQPRGEISVYNLIGAKIAQIPVKEWIVLPNSEGKQVVIWNKKWLVGRYRADAKYFYGDNQTLESSLVFYAFPWHLLLIVIAIIITLYYLIKYLKSRYEIRLSASKKNKTETVEDKNQQEEDEKSTEE
jgi:hypothetical protein